MESTTVKTKAKWNIDSMHSEIGFKVKHLVFTNVRGNFKEYSAGIEMSDNDPESIKVMLTIDAASIHTGDEKRDAHLKSVDFFDVDVYKEIVFTGNNIKKNNGNNYKLTGDLLMKGIKKQVQLDVEFNGLIKDPWGNNKAAFSITGKINRKEWGLNWNAALETGGLLVSEDVWINCDVQLIND